MPRRKRPENNEHGNVGSTQSAHRGSMLFDLLALLSARKSKSSPAMEHLRKAELEFLKALNLVLEHRIKTMEECIAQSNKRRVRKIEIEGE